MTRVDVDPGRRILIARCFFAAREGTRRANKIRFEWRSFTIENHRLTSLRVQTACFRFLHFERIYNGTPAQALNPSTLSYSLGYDREHYFRVYSEA